MSETKELFEPVKKSTHSSEETFTAWPLPRVGKPITNDSVLTPSLTEEEIDDIKTSAFQKAFSEGLSAGESTAQKKIDQKVEQIDQLLLALTKPFEQQNTSLNRQIVALIRGISETIIQRELAIKPIAMEGLIEEALSLLPANESIVCIAINQDDKALVDDLIKRSRQKGAVRIDIDSSIQPGGFKVSLDNQMIDQRLEKRFSRMVDHVLSSLDGLELNDEDTAR